MPGYIRRRGKHSWEVSVRAGCDPVTGRYLRMYRTVRGTRKDAERILARLLHEVATGGVPTDSTATLREYLEAWLERYTGLAGTTRERYETLIRLHVLPRIGHLRLDRLRPVHLEDLYRTLQEPRTAGGAGLSPTTVLQVHRILHRAFVVGVRWGVLSRNPADHATPPRKATLEVTPPPPEDIQRLLDSLRGTRLHTPVALAALLGLRRGELLALRWSDVDLEARTVAVVRAVEETRSGGVRFKDLKNPRSRRLLPLPPMAVEVLRAHRAAQAAERLRAGPEWEDQGLVFPAPDGRIWGPKAFTTAFRKAAARARVKTRFHDLRHHVATSLLTGGADVRTTAAILGHADPATTLRVYAHAVRAAQEEALRRVEQALRSQDTHP